MGRGSCSRSRAPRAPWLSCRQIRARRLTYRSPSSLCAVRKRANRWRTSRYRRAIAGFHPRSRRGFPSTLRSCSCGWLKAFAKESPSAQTSMWPSNATSWLTRFRRRRTPGSARFFSDTETKSGHSAGRMALTVFGGIAEFERGLIRERTGTAGSPL